MAFARHPIYGLMTYIAVFYLHPPSRWWGETLPDMRWALLAACVTAIALLVRKPQGDQGPPLMKHGFFIGMLLFILWLCVQTLWALHMPMHLELLNAYFKYALLIAVMYKTIETPQHLKLVLWTHVLGCLYLGYIVLVDYEGGRFEGFGGPDINEANAGALQVVTGIVTVGALFLSAKLWEKAGALACIPLIVNALIATVSRSGFLAIGVAGLVFNFFTPQRFRKTVRVMTVLAIVLFVLLTNPVYWARIMSLKYAGEDVEGVDTGQSRIAIIEAQLRMFEAHPLGCGHRCTAVLSTEYIEDRFLTGVGENRGRASHNTFMSLLVEQGIFGVIFYVALVLWVAKNLLRLRRSLNRSESFLADVYPAIAACLAAIFVGDVFVDYLKAEVRIWFIALLMVMIKLVAMREAAEGKAAPSTAGDPAPSAVAARRLKRYTRISRAGG